MDATTFSQDHIAKYINEHYYPVKFDAQYKEMIEYKGSKYIFVKSFSGGYHELAAAILNGRLSYPSTVFLDEEANIIQAIPGFQNDEDFEMIIHYFGENHHKTTPWNKYVKNFTPKSCVPKVPVKSNKP